MLDDGRVNDIFFYQPSFISMSVHLSRQMMAIEE